MKDKALTLTNARELFKQAMELLALNPNKKYRLTIVEWRKRSVSSNSLQHLWYNALNKHFGYFADEHNNPAKEMCKVMFGIPIILNNPTYGQQISQTLDRVDYYNMSFSDQCNLVRIISVTSLFTVSESKEYMDNIIFYFADKDVDINYKD
jgi:hypothetical protein